MGGADTFVESALRIEYLMTLLHIFNNKTVSPTHDLLV